MSSEMLTEITQQISATKGRGWFTDENGRIRIVDLLTGETKDGSLMAIAYDDDITTARERQAREERKEKERRKYLQRNLDKELGAFYFVKSEAGFDDLPPETLARLLFLATYMQKHNDTLLMKTEKTVMQKKDIIKLLGLPDTTFRRFWKDVAGKYVHEKEDGIFMEKDYFWRGSLRKKVKGQHHPYLEYQKAHIEAIRDLYRRTEVSKHRYLGYVFQMLPYINYEYNILCYNPSEINPTEIVPITLSAFCTAVGYSAEKQARLRKVYSGITFNVNGEQEYFCIFSVTGSRALADAYITVNPRIFYRGSDWKNVAGFEVLASAQDKFGGRRFPS